MLGICRRLGALSLRPNAGVGLGRFPRLGVAAPIELPMAHSLVAQRGMANHRHKKVIKLAKGYRGRANRVYSIAYHRVQKARQYAYRDRKVKKRDFRSLWIQRINAGARIYGLTYSALINSMVSAKIVLNRMVLADMAMTEPLSFRSVVEVVKSLGGKAVVAGGAGAVAGGKADGTKSDKSSSSSGSSSSSSSSKTKQQAVKS